MRINRVLIACCKKDYYLTRICVASIRYWNPDIAIYLLKDNSQGKFSTTELEQQFNVGIAPLPFPNMQAYSKLWPFVAPAGSRVLVMDSDIIWLGDLVGYLEQFPEDLLVHADTPSMVEKEMNLWYFKYQNNHPLFVQYQYPGYLFNTGQMVLNTGLFALSELTALVNWKDHTTTRFPDIFFCEDQGIINYLVAQQLLSHKVSVRPVPMYAWGWQYDQKMYSLEKVKARQAFPLMLHWYGTKKGLLYSMPQPELLRYFETRYYTHLPGGWWRLYRDRLFRTIRNPGVFITEIVKRLARVFYPKDKAR